MIDALADANPYTSIAFQASPVVRRAGKVVGRPLVLSGRMRVSDSTGKIGRGKGLGEIGSFSPRDLPSPGPLPVGEGTALFKPGAQWMPPALARQPYNVVTQSRDMVMANRLSHELSPYLLQHAGNPVDWRPWDAEALRLARQEQKPIFLSIGYSSCHWCHVMAHESFEDPEIARLLNEHFVSIKVDREERLDLDQIYMEAVQMMTGRGGWPMSVFLTPEGKPFFGGTYWPPQARGGMPGFDQVLRAVADAWQHRRNELLAQAERMTQLVAGSGRARLRRRDRPSWTTRRREAAEAALRQSFDPQYGGFGPAPKFPQPLALRWLLGRWRRSGDDALLEHGHHHAGPHGRRRACSIISAAAFTATASTPAGWCRISRRCSTTMPCWPSAISKPGRPRARSATPTWCGKRSTICSAT